LNEKKVLLEYSHPFIVDLHYVFETPKKTFFIMNYVRCGDLYHHLKAKVFFKESIAKFYGAQIILALGFLHSHLIIYRDLKLENVLLEKDGYVVLADFGMSKFLKTGDERS
jgi:serine/threonine protein kinase